MSPWLRILIISAVAASTWFAASFVCANYSECFYVTVPVLALTHFLTGLRDVRAGLKTAVRQGLLIVVVFFVMAIVPAVAFVGSPAYLPHISWRFWAETAIALYFLMAIAIVLFTIRRLLAWPAQVMHERWNFSPLVRLGLCQALPFVLFLLLAVPLGLAFSNVHRFKFPNLTDPQEAQGRPFEDVTFFSEDGTELRGWWIPAKKPSARTVIICHGVAANRTQFLPFTEVGDWLDANVFMFDMRGHGDSAGHTVTLGCLEKDDVLAAVAYVRRERPEQARQVVGVGVSMGAATLAEAAAVVEPPLDAVILDSCFTSTRDMTHSVLQPFPSFCHGWLLTVGLPLVDLHAGCPMMEVRPEAKIDQLRAPVVFLHSRGDPLIPSQHAIRLHARAAGPKQLHIFELNGHCDAFFARHEEYRKIVESLVLARPAVPGR